MFSIKEEIDCGYYYSSTTDFTTMDETLLQRLLKIIIFQPNLPRMPSFIFMTGSMEVLENLHLQISVSPIAELMSFLI